MSSERSHTLKESYNPYIKLHNPTMSANGCDRSREVDKYIRPLAKLFYGIVKGFVSCNQYPPCNTSKPNGYLIGSSNV